MLLLDIPNQVKAKNIFIRGYCYNRQLFARAYEPFIWKKTEELRRRYEEPLAVVNRRNAKPSGKQTIVLEFKRDDEVAEIKDNEFLAEQNRIRKLLIGSCRLVDNKMEKNGQYELI